MRRFLIVLAAEVFEVNGAAAPVALIRPRTGLYAYGTDADDALARTEDALASLVDAERAGDIPRK